MKAFLQEELFLRLLRSPYGLLQPNRPQSNVNAKRSAERFESTGKILADGFKFSINADTVDFTETHDHLNRGISAQTVTGNFRTVFLITDVTHVYEKKAWSTKGSKNTKKRNTRKSGEHQPSLSSHRLSVYRYTYVCLFGMTMRMARMPE
jgi:hypothetical protein